MSERTVGIARVRRPAKNTGATYTRSAEAACHGRDWGQPSITNRGGALELCCACCVQRRKELVVPIGRPHRANSAIG